MIYYEEVFLRNIDIWGFITIYLAIYEEINMYDKLNNHQIKFLNKVKYIIIHFLY